MIGNSDSASPAFAAIAIPGQAPEPPVAGRTGHDAGEGTRTAHGAGPNGYRGYNCNGARLILAEVQLERGQAAADQLMLEFQLESQFVFKPGTRFNRP